MAGGQKKILIIAAWNDGFVRCEAVPRSIRPASTCAEGVTGQRYATAIRDSADRARPPAPERVGVTD